MTVEQAVLDRRSIRRFDADIPVADDDLRKILEAGRQAPSAINIQPWVFIVVRDPEIKAEVADKAMMLDQNREMCEQAPVLLVCCAQLDAADAISDRLHDLAATGLVDAEMIPQLAKRYGNSFERMPEPELREYMVLNLTIAVTQMVLQAAALGYGTCWLKGFSEKRVRRILNVPENLHISTVVPLGRAAEKPPAPRRKPLEEIVVWDSFPADDA